MGFHPGGGAAGVAVGWWWVASGLSWAWITLGLILCTPNPKLP